MRIVTAFRAATVRLNDTIEQAVAAAREADVKIVYVDVAAAFAGHGITLPPEPETPVPFINARSPVNDSVYKIFTRTPQATAPMPMPSPMHCQTDG